MARTYTDASIAASPNGRGYYERRERLFQALADMHGGLGSATVSELVVALGWDLYEIAGKLRSLRSDGFVTYRGGWWRVAK